MRILEYMYEKIFYVIFERFMFTRKPSTNNYPDEIKLVQFPEGHVPPFMAIIVQFELSAT